MSDSNSKDDSNTHFEFIKEPEKLNLLIKANELLRINKSKHNRILFVYSAPKVGSTSIVSSFRIFGLDKVLPHMHINFKEAEGIKTPWHRTTLLTLAITLHNIPEGLAIGVLFGGVAAGIPEASITGAVVLAIGIGIQNFPEGIAVSMPLRRQGMSRWKSFMYGQASAAVEPIAAVIGAVAVTFFTPILPYALAFAAGAMIFVVVEEVIPETQRDKYTDIATLGFIGGFIVMMSLDVGLG